MNTKQNSRNIPQYNNVQTSCDRSCVLGLGPNRFYIEKISNVVNTRFEFYINEQLIIKEQKKHFHATFSPEGILSGGDQASHFFDQKVEEMKGRKYRVIKYSIL